MCLVPIRNDESHSEIKKSIHDLIYSIEYFLK